MNSYIAIHCKVNPVQPFSEILIAQLAEIGFDMFEEKEDGFDGYIRKENFNESLLETIEFLQPNDFCSVHWQLEEIESQNWNEEWEKNYFEPIIIDNECVIHSSFHKNVPKARYEIIIDPKMSFGTGHHETTSLMISEILGLDLKGKTILDMGCGTSVLAILASMCGAEKILAIDIDDWCTNNSEENIKLNNITNIEIKTGGAELLNGLQFDIILANINRNILLADIEKYSACLSQSGKLIMSGFYKEDISIIEAEANRNDLKLIEFKEKNNWVAIETEKMV